MKRSFTILALFASACLLMPACSISVSASAGSKKPSSTPSKGSTKKSEPRPDGGSRPNG